MKTRQLNSLNSLWELLHFRILEASITLLEYNINSLASMLLSHKEAIDDSKQQFRPACSHSGDNSARVFFKDYLDW